MDKNKPNLNSLLLKLLSTIKENYDHFNSNEKGEIYTIEEAYNKITAEIQNYNQGIKSSNFSSEIITKPSKFWTDFPKYLNRVKEKFPIIDDVINALENDFQFSNKEATDYLFWIFYGTIIDKEENLLMRTVS